eukprot:1140532-Pelagomonas_calceolata.AAC.7
MELGQNHGKVHVCKRAAEGVAFNLCSSKTARGLENSVRGGRSPSFSVLSAHQHTLCRSMSSLCAAAVHESLLYLFPVPPAAMHTPFLLIVGMAALMHALLAGSV